MNRAILPLLAAILVTLPTASIRADNFGQVVDPPITDRERQHWSFVPPQRVPIPALRDATVRTPIDAFVLQKLQSKGLKFSPEADALTLLRRVTFDLTGLPPTLEEQQRFLADTAPGAYERLVDRLLASPHYGERWAQHWLDVLRYAESNGYEADGDRPHAWRFRDYVVKSFNDDKPFDRFLTEQIGGDELAAAQGGGRDSHDLWVASGMHRCGPQHMVGGNTDVEVLRQEVLTEMVNGVGATFLGLTVGCARCHDHKFDPFSQADYFRLQAFFASTKAKDVDLSTPEERSAFEKKLLDLMVQVKPFKDQVAAIDAPYRARIAEEKKAKLPPKYRDALATPEAKRTPEQKQLVKDVGPLIKVDWNDVIDALSPEDRVKRQRLREQQHALEAKMPSPPMQVWAVANQGEPPLTYVLHRGEVKKKKGTVIPTFPRILVGNHEIPTPPAPMRFTRLDLAKWLTRPDHPLTARVFVNRMWQHHFGRGIVGTPNDFGIRGEKPSHPELLDYLATRFIDSGWRIKDMHRLMVTSTTYRQSTQTAPLADDPNNTLLSRMNRRRLEGEAIRDAMLAAAGQLNAQVGGPMVRIPLEPEVYDLIFTEGEPDGLWHVTPDESQHERRSLYLFAKRNVRLPLMEAFDQPDRLSSCAEREISTFAPQALILMNGPIAQESSHRFAARILREANDDRARVELAYRLAFGRAPRDVEVQTALAFLAEQTSIVRERLLARQPVALPADAPAQVDPAEVGAWCDLALALFNTNEFIFVR